MDGTWRLGAKNETTLRGLWAGTSSWYLRSRSLHDARSICRYAMRPICSERILVGAGSKAKEGRVKEKKEQG